MPKKSHTQQTEKKKKQEPWHALEYEEVLKKLDTTIEGLDVAEMVIRTKRYGHNEFTQTPPKGVFARLYGQLKSPLALVLVIAFFVTLALGEYVDAGVISFALSIAVVIGVVQEGKASRAFVKLAESQTKTAVVIREGKKHEIAAKDIVPGDIVEIHAGMYVSADMRIIDTKALKINEATLTGEWLGVGKTSEPTHLGASVSERTNMAWMGTFVSAGYGLGVVVETGDETEVGQLADSIQHIEEEETPLQEEMRKLSKIMLIIIVVLVSLIFIIGLLRGESLHTMLITSIAIAVASIPEGLPAAVTIILAVGMDALLKRGGLVRNLLAAETLGSTTYILTDKTGTLTQAKMSVASVTMRDNKELAPDVWETHKEARQLFDTALAATDAFVDEQKDGSLKINGEPMERAVLHAARTVGIGTSGGSLRGARIDFLEFTSENRFAAGLAHRAGKNILCINGSPEHVLAASTHIHTVRGVHPMTDEDRAYFSHEIDRHTKQGSRLMAVAYQETDAEDIPDDATPELMEQSVFMGLIIFHDPIREEIDKSIAAVKGAGARVVLVTGDNPQTALSIAHQAGITKNDKTLLGKDIEEMDDENLLKALKTVSVFARVLPQQKMRLARVLQQKGEIVAMTGDGVNDAPALQKADIGIAVGSGTEVAKEASDLVLVKDSFATITAAIEEGRRIVSNLRKIVGYLLSTSLSEVALIGTALIAGLPVPLTAAQILWANIIEEGLMSVAFAFEKGEKNAMKMKPQDVHEEGILSRDMVKFMTFVILVMSTLLVLLYWYVHARGDSIEIVRSVMFLAISIDSLFIAFAFRSLGTPIWQIDLRSNLFFLGAFLVSVALLLTVILVPFFQFLLSYTPLPLGDIGLVLGFGLLTLVTIEIGKAIFFKKK